MKLPGQFSYYGTSADSANLENFSGKKKIPKAKPESWIQTLSLYSLKSFWSNSQRGFLAYRIFAIKSPNKSFARNSITEPLLLVYFLKIDIYPYDLSNFFNTYLFTL